MDPNVWYPALSILTLIAMVGQYAISGLGYEGPHKSNEVFRHTESEQLDKYATTVSPFHWAHRIWFAIYAWQALWVIYALHLLCRRGNDGGRCYANPVFLTPTLFVLTILHFGCHIGWQLLMDRDELLASFVLLAVNVVLLGASLGSSYYALSKADVILRGLKRDYDIWLTRILLHNSLGLQLGWATVVTFLHMAKFMMYQADPEVNSEIAGSAAICAILALCLAYSILDIGVLDRRFSRYTITTNVGIAYGMAVSIDRNFEEGNRNTILTIVTLVAAVAFFLIKVAVLVYEVSKKKAPLPKKKTGVDHSPHMESIPHYEVTDYNGKTYLLY